MIATILFTVFLDCYVGKMHEHIIHFSNVRGVQLVTKSAKTLIVNVSLNGTIARTETFINLGVQ